MPACTYIQAQYNRHYQVARFLAQQTCNLVEPLNLGVKVHCAAHFLLGCANANGWINIYTVGQTSFSYLSTFLEQEINNFCAGYDGIQQTAVSVTQAYAFAVARVFGNWVQYACLAPANSCCADRSAASNLVKGDGIAVASAVAYTFTTLSSKISSTQNGTCAAALACAFATSDAFGADTQIAVLETVSSWVQSPPPTAKQCTTNAVQSRVACGFASAFACAVAKVLTSVSADPTPDSGSCSDSVALAGIRSNAVLVCPGMCYSVPPNQITPTCTADPNSGSFACTGTYCKNASVTVDPNSAQVTMLSPEGTIAGPMCPDTGNAVYWEVVHMMHDVYIVAVPEQLLRISGCLKHKACSK